MDTQSHETLAQSQPDAQNHISSPGPRKGSSGNRPLTTLLCWQVCHGQGPDGEPWKSILVKKLLDLAAAGNLRAIQEIWTRVEGKPGAPVTKASAPLEISDEVARRILEIGREAGNDIDDDEDDRDDDGTEPGD